MSIERELLKRFMTELKTEEDVVSLFNDIKECLAEPEQTEQEPVAWIIETEIYGKLSEWVCTDKKRYMEAHDGTKDPIPLYLAPPKQPESTAEAVMPNGVCVSNVYDAYEEGRKSVMSEQEPVAWKVVDRTTGDFMFSRVKPMERSYKYDVVIPLYTAPQKREPLGEDKLDVLAEANISDEAIAGYYLGFRDAEKHHGIGGGE